MVRTKSNEAICRFPDTAWVGGQRFILDHENSPEDAELLADLAVEDGGAYGNVPQELLKYEVVREAWLTHTGRRRLLALRAARC